MFTLPIFFILDSDFRIVHYYSQIVILQEERKYFLLGLSLSTLNGNSLWRGELLVDHQSWSSVHQFPNENSLIVGSTNLVGM